MIKLEHRSWTDAILCSYTRGRIKDEIVMIQFFQERTAMAVIPQHQSIKTEELQKEEESVKIP